MSKDRKKPKKPTGGTMGAIIVGFDQQIFRTLPPPHELVVKSTPQRGQSGQDPELEIVFPDDLVVDDEPPTAERDADV
jgi:hypothetical protein